LEELKELLRRTSQVEQSLCQIEARDEDCGPPGNILVQQAQRSSPAERPEVDLVPDTENQDEEFPESRGSHRERAERHNCGEEEVPKDRKILDPKGNARRAQSPAPKHTRYLDS
jgi:hypothetical protein